MSNQSASPKPVVVSVSAASVSRDAVWWAASYAHRHETALHLVPTAGGVGEDVGERVRERFPDLVVTRHQARRTVVEALAAQSEGARLVVVGHHRQGPLAARRDQSVTAALSALARCPVVAVPPGAGGRSTRRPVVVGVSGDALSGSALSGSALSGSALSGSALSGEARTAEVLTLAFAEADRLGAEVRVVCCALRRRSGDGLAATAAIHHLVATVAACYPGVPVRTQLPDCSPASALAWHARFGSLMVVNAGASGLRGLGAVRRALLRQPLAPVMVIGPHALAAAPH
ncbi:universal stress protein [Goodfellowiella coeruleoviolacea]|uniref:Universal stress protein family protein n=1 Tax=Goodfellowiella coeruleoviolacea TaxID=334858 RepID=A0AAE3KJI6_9PSEU|nr:universal stress protein [Goodfellowiella coeruleoviolacea]MCP2168439.1 Universal stress protein family protein [Goodfellowiella coeruleoviolacea]